MNRIHTAGVALAATLGMAGLAMAQNYAPTTNPSPSPGATSTMPAPSTTPGGSPQGALQNGPQTPAGIQQAQQQLRAQGLYNGAIDGQLGPEMKTALTQFQQRNGLPQTGMLDQQTSALLTQNNNGLNPTPTSGAAMPGNTRTNPPPATNR